ncbi:hypothetical protein [Mycobacterium sp.]|uniref:hypothetical protein n=1 Tax=Mycobacterium sp. TaxID=1785 RepID=UPI0031DC1F41
MTEPNNPGPANPESRIIRRAPTGRLPQAVDYFGTTHIPQPSGLSQQQFAPRPELARVPFGEPSRTTAVAAAAVSIISGWATSVVATELIAGWWHSDRLFCVAVAFLALVFSAATISGVILLLLRQPLSRYLIVAGAVVAILTYLGVFIAGARVAWVVHTLPLLPITSTVLTLMPRTRDWLLEY